MRKWSLVVLLLPVSLLCLPDTTYSWNEPTHKDQLTRMALELLKQYNPGRYGPGRGMMKWQGTELQINRFFKGPAKNKFPFSGVEASVWQGVRSE